MSLREFLTSRVFVLYALVTVAIYLAVYGKTGDVWLAMAVGGIVGVVTAISTEEIDRRLR